MRLSCFVVLCGLLPLACRSETSTWVRDPEGGATKLPLPEAPALDLGVVSLRGTVLSGTLFGSLRAGERVRADMVYASGARPTRMRVWLGGEADDAGAVDAREVVEKVFRAVWPLDRDAAAGDQLWLEATMPNRMVVRGAYPLPSGK